MGSVKNAPSQPLFRDFWCDRKLNTLNIHLFVSSNYSVHHCGLPLSKTGNNISISALQIRLKVVTIGRFNHNPTENPTVWRYSDRKQPNRTVCLTQIFNTNPKKRKYVIRKQDKVSKRRTRNIAASSSCILRNRHSNVQQDWFIADNGNFMVSFALDTVKFLLIYRFL